MSMKIKLSLFKLLIGFVLPVLCNAQVRTNTVEGNIYLDIGNYDSTINAFIASNNIKVNKRLTMSAIDPDRNGRVDFNAVNRYINTQYPDNNAAGLCVIDWEGTALKNLKNYVKGNDTFKWEMEEYIKLVKYIKEIRPNLKLGVYDIPFRNYARNRLTSNPYDYARLDPLLSICDFLAPCLYRPYNEKEQGSTLSKAYFQNSIKIALGVGKIYDLPVYPYITMKIYGGNTISNDKLMKQSVFKHDIEVMNSTIVDGRSISGFIIWNGDYWNFKNKNRGKKLSDIQTQEFLKEHNSIIKTYSKIVINSNK